ncbi:hypothetical protein A245_09601 [Pseudomonas syringae pv. actinidiae ICMP 19096]|uniref:Uncharacterized protein n=1 Tax=Pseudomonas syringae pv. actinidiae ICMP 19096 TaxID=1194405 RepID=A0A656K130_PSESF|nr:hypothetical protein A245_09601 [Pseudomonas syringae pv. actinidiae ICMP 19096]
MLHIGLFPDVILADAFERAGLPAISPAVADMGKGEAPLASSQRFCASNRRSSDCATPQVSGVE